MRPQRNAIRHPSEHYAAAAAASLTRAEPKLNPVENIWQYMRENWLSNRVFEKYGDIVDRCCDAWNNLQAAPPTITSIGRGAWAHGS